MTQVGETSALGNASPLLFPGQDKIKSAYAEFWRHLDQIRAYLSAAERSRDRGELPPDLVAERDFLVEIEPILVDLKND